MSNDSNHDLKRKPTNATARLSALLERLANSSSTNQTADVLASALGTTDNDPNRSFLLAYTAMTYMLESSQKEVESHLKDELDFYLAPFRPLRHCFSPKSSGQQWNAYKQNLTATDVTKISYTAQLLKSKISETEPLEDDFKSVLIAVKNLEDALNNELLSKHTRDTLQGYVDEIRRAVAEYQIWGPSKLDLVLRTLTGTLVIDKTIKEDLAKDETSGGHLTETIKRVGGELVWILKFVNLVYDTAQHLPGVETFIHHLTSGTN